MDSIRYSNCWEDANSLCAALQPRPGSRILSVGSAGDNALALLAEGAEVVVADISRSQLAAIELKCAAFASLDESELLGFLGVVDVPDRLRLFSKLKSYLSPLTRRYWEAQLGQVALGLIHAGRLEKYFRLFRTRILPLIHTQKCCEELLQEKDKQNRRDFYDRVWNTRCWRLMFRLFFSRFVMARLGRDRRHFRFVRGSIAEQIFRRTEFALRELPTHNNPYLEYIVRGTFRFALPRYLEPERFEAVRDGLGRLTLLHGSIEAVGLDQRQAGFDGFNLSNIFEYLSPSSSVEIYSRLLPLAKSGARLAYWNAFVPRSTPKHLQGIVHHLADLSTRLFQEDRAFFYQQFLVDQVERTSTVPA